MKVLGIWGCWVLALCALPVGAQNLVPNPGFESYHQCPPYLGQIHEAVGWDSPNNNTTDYFHRCSPVADGAGVPVNRVGEQTPAEGDAYAGIRTWIPAGNQYPVYREYLCTELAEALRAGQPYSISCMVSLAETSTHTSDDIGIYLSNVPFDNERVYSYPPALRPPEGQLIANTASWTRITGTYIAQGGERFLILGNFLDDAQMTRQRRLQTTDAQEMVYFYIDDVRVIACEPPAQPLDLGRDTTLCAGDSLSLNLPAFWEDPVWQDGTRSPRFTLKQPGTYVVQAQVGACTYADTLVVTAPPFPELPLVDTFLCEGDRLVFELPAHDSLVYTWQDGSADARYEIAQPGKYVLEMAFGDCYRADSFTVSVEEAPAGAVRQVDTFVCQGERIALFSTRQGLNLWADGGQEPLRWVNEPGIYKLTTFGPCFDEEIRFVVDARPCACEAFVPNVFTPNGDGWHDAFLPEFSLSVQNYALQVFNRWGRKVFESYQPGYTWDGTGSDGQALPQDVYYWTLWYDCLQISTGTGRQSLSGQVTLLR